jgi:hypothetical protein
LKGLGPAAGTPRHFAMKSDRQLDLTAAICSWLGCCAAA